MGSCTRRGFLAGAGAAAGLAAAEVGRRTAQAAAPPRKNILLFVADDLGRNDAGCYGNPAIKTPGLDRLAASGTRFTNAYCSSPSCSPSRSVILTGMHNHANGMYGLQHAAHHFQSFDKVVSLPKRLADRGYTRRWRGNTMSGRRRSTPSRRRCPTRRRRTSWRRNAAP